MLLNNWLGSTVALVLSQLSCEIEQAKACMYFVQACVHVYVCKISVCVCVCLCDSSCEKNKVTKTQPNLVSLWRCYMYIVALLFV